MTRAPVWPGARGTGAAATAIVATAPRAPSSHEELRALYEREFGFVWQSLRRLGVPERDLPDVTHDVFVTVWRCLGNYDPTRPFRPWLFGVLFRVASDNLRLARNVRELLSQEDDTFDVLDPAPRPDERVLDREAWEIVDAALATLDLKHRAVLLMYEFADDDVVDIADALGIPLKTVYSRLRTARERFAVAVQRAQSRTRRRR